MPDTRPRIVFSESGICNGCATAAARKEIDWSARRAEFEKLIERHRSRDGGYDCIVPWSGGKDSSYIAYKLKFEFGLNPLLVTFSPLIPNEVGAVNRARLLDLGFNHLFFQPDRRISRHLARRFFVERGNPKVHWDAGVNTVPVQVAVNYRVPLVFYAEHGESEYGGRLLSEEHRKIRDLAEVLENNIGDDPMNWVDDVVSEPDLSPYLYPDTNRIEEVGVKAMYFAYFFPWDVKANYDFISGKIDFMTAPNGRTDGTFTDYDSLDDKIDDLYYHMQFVKFGFGRALRDASRLIQRGRMTRDEGLDLVRKYDDEFPETHISEVRKFLDLNETELHSMIDRHRNEEIWAFKGNAWELRHPPR